MFDLYITDSKTIFHFELRCFDHIFCALKHEIYFKLISIVDQMHVFYVYLSFLPYDLTLT